MRPAIHLSGIEAGRARAQRRLHRGLTSAFRHDNHANILGLPHDSENQVRKDEAVQEAALFGPPNKDLRDLIAMGKIHDGLGRIVAFQNPALDVQIPGEVQMFLDPFNVLSRRTTRAALRQYADSKAIRAQVIGHSAAAPDEHGR